MGTDIYGVWQKRVGGKWVDTGNQIEQRRDYLLFAWLGNVRNGFGTAGAPTHTSITPLSNRRGYPDGFIAGGHDLGDHSHSWVTADEILSATMPRILRTGIINREQFAAWDGGSAPGDGYIGGVMGLGIKVSSPSDVDDTTTHVQVEWFEDTAESLKYFIEEVRRLKNEHGEIRFVFGFD